MSDAIDRAALHDEVEYRLRTAAAHYRSCGKHGTDPGDFLDREIEAMTERLVGLLAPAPLREVTTAEELDALITMRGTVVLDCDGNAWQSCSQCSPLWPDANIWMSAITSAYNSRTSDVLGQVAPLTVLHVPADAVNRAEDAGNAAVNHAGRRIRQTITDTLQAEP